MFRKFGVLLIGLALVCGAVGMFGYRWSIKADQQLRSPAASTFAPSGGRRNILTEQRRDNTPGSGAKSGTGSPVAAGWMSLDLVLNALNALCGIVGVWMAWLGLRMQRAVAAMQSGRPRDAGQSPPIT